MFKTELLVSESVGVTLETKQVFSAILSVTIVVVGKLYTPWAIKLTQLENNETDTQYKDSLIIKLFVVNVVNSYVALYYTAFIMKQMRR